MILYLWMHWFWITYCISVLCCSQPTPMTASSSSHFVNETSIPPASVSPVNQTNDHSTEKPCKFIFKKHLIKNTTVIEQNFTIPLTDNDTLSTTNHSYFENNSSISEFDYIDEPDTSHNNLSAAGITGITVGCIGIVGIICAVSFVIYRNRGFNRPQVLNDRCSNPDSSGYIDDASIRDNSEEMYSLDNDSFLNSLEAMTIQNYWTDSVKHTKL